VLKVTGTEPALPSGSVYLSDLTWTYAANGLASPVQKDANWNGQPLSMGGTTYARGLGVAAPSLVIYRLAPGCTSFTANVGLDDSGRPVTDAGADSGGGSGAGGSVVFQVWADDEEVFDSGSINGPTFQVKPVSVALHGQARLKLLVTNDQDGALLDRADWANAKLVCPSSPP
jgi:alpha-galactosidase